MINGQKEQRDSGQTLLSVNNEKLLHRASFTLDGNDTTKKMTLPILADDLYQIIIELLAVLHFPVVISLVDGDDEALGSTIHIFD